LGLIRIEFVTGSISDYFPKATIFYMGLSNFIWENQ